MPFQRLLLLLPCQSLETLELNRPAEEAEQILAGYSALWHPALVHVCQTLPRTMPAPLAPLDLDQDLVVLPECAESLLPEDWLKRNRSSSALLQRYSDRPALVQAVLERLEAPGSEVEAELAADFLALGYCHFVVEVFARQQHSMGNLDESALQKALLAAAAAAALGDGPSARKNLQTAFDRLHDTREYAYHGEVQLLDLTLAASTTLGEMLRSELRRGIPHNVMISGEVLEQLAAEGPPILAAFRDALANHQAALVGGEYTEAPLPLFPPEAIAEELRRGLETYQRHLALRPVVYGRRRFGLTLALPQILEKHGFTAAAHFTLDDGQFPAGHQSRIQWQGFDETAMEALAQLPLDAGKADAFLRLPRQLGETMERDHAPTLVFAHWPGRASPWYDDLRRIEKYSSVLGNFQLLTEYFEQTSMAGQHAHYRIDQYRSPYLMQDVAAGAADPLSRTVQYYRRWLGERNRAALHAFAQLASGRRSTEDFRKMQNADTEQQLADALGAQPGKPDQAINADPGYLLLNPWSFSHRCGVLLPQRGAAPAVGDAVRAADENAAVVDLPGAGFAWIGPAKEIPPSPAKKAEKSGWFLAKKKAEPPLAEENYLRNEFFELRFDPQTGALRAISDYQTRHPRLAQQIALRMPHGGEEEPGSDRNYSIMVLDEMTVTSPGPVFGELVCRGRLMDRQGQRVAGYRQTTRVWRGSRVIELQIEIDPYRLPDDRPWNSYYACRFAWSDESCNLARSVNWANRPTEAIQLEAPLLIDIRSDPQRTTLLTGGLPYHRRLGLRKIDSLLIVKGETARTFRLGIGLDLPNPTTAALAFLTPPVIVRTSRPPTNPSGWLFHLDHRNVIATHWEPLWDVEGRGERGEGRGEGDSAFRTPHSALEKLLGFRVRLLETEGRSAKLGLRCLRPIAAAQKLETGDTPPTQLNVDGDRIAVPIGPYQWFDVEARFVP